MPDHKLHATLDYLLFGRAYPEVHDFLDQFQPYLQSGHRAFLHDNEGIQMVWDQTCDQGAVAAAYMHILLDEISDIVGQERSIPTILELFISGQLQ